MESLFLAFKMTDWHDSLMNTFIFDDKEGNGV